jgi:hypothetical protein
MRLISRVRDFSLGFFERFDTSRNQYCYCAGAGYRLGYGKSNSRGTTCNQDDLFMYYIMK